jgi:hypothetical protein
LNLSLADRIALYVVFGLGAFFTALLAFGSLAGAFHPSPREPLLSLMPPSSVADSILAFALLAVAAAHIGASVGIARDREWGRAAATYVAGFWASTVVFLPVALGVLLVLWHPHLLSPGRAVGRVATAAQARHVYSPAAVALLALAVLAFTVMRGLILTADAGHDAVIVTLAFVAVDVVIAIVAAAAVIGVGRGETWGVPLAIWCAGSLVWAWVAWLLALAAVVVLLRRPVPERSGGEAPATA